MSAIPESAPTVPAPTAPDVLPDIPGGEVNLIPRAAASAPLRLEFPSWFNSNPSPGLPEQVALHWDGVLVATKVWHASIAPDDHFILAPLSSLTDGLHDVFYELTIYTGVVTPSDPMSLTIDKTAPVLAGVDGLIFHSEVIANGVTASYLAAHDDKVIADVPGYDDPSPGDTLTWFWDKTPAERNEAGFKTLALTDIGKPLTATFTGDTIRDSGDGARHAYYEVRDRAGNLSPLSRAVTLQASATPVPRNLPWPAVDSATGSGERITLAPERAASGSTVIVPDDADVWPGEILWVQWAESGQLGYYRTSTPDPAGTRRYAIPKEYVAPQIGKQLPVSYEAKGPVSTVGSAVRQLQVLQLDSSRLPLIRIQGHTGTQLSLAGIPADGVPLHLETWTLMATTQRVTIKVSGVATTGQPVETVVTDRHPVTDAELIGGVTATVARPFMASLRLNTAFSITVFVSFDQGVTWPSLPNFPINDDIVLVA